MPNPNSPSASRTGRSEGPPAGSLERLLDGAQVTFAERGYNGANIKEICARSNVGIGTFYAHFTHKRELIQRVCVERTFLLTTNMTPAILRHHDQLVAFLQRVNDDAAAAGLLRAWYEAVLEEPEIARFHAKWRASTLEVLARTVAQAQAEVPSTSQRLPPALVAWTMATLSREMGIHDRQGAPDMPTLATLIEQLVFGRLLAPD